MRFFATKSVSLWFLLVKKDLNVDFEIDAGFLQLKIMFKKDDDKGFYSSFEAFRKRLAVRKKNKTISDEKEEKYLHFGYFLQNVYFKKDKDDRKKEELINEVKNSKIYKTLIDKFPDAELTDVKLNKKED